jgi:hypothetical protein
MSQSFATGNPLELAKQIGYELYDNIGKIAFEELELAYASRLAPKFEKVPELRSFTNLNFYWARGCFKNRSIEGFKDCLPEDFKQRNISTATIETMFGSINEKGNKLFAPLFHGYETCFMPELLAFLGSYETMKEKVNTFNEVLEGDPTSRDMIKFSSASEELIGKYMLGYDGLTFDGRHLKYEPNTSFVVGTRPVENKIYTYLEQSGFWSRFHTIQIKITDKVSEDIFTGSFTPNPDVDVQSLKNELKLCNKNLFAHRDDINSELPSYEKIMMPLLQTANGFCKQVMLKNPIIDNVTLLNVRIKDDILREVKAYQILNPELSDAEIHAWAYARLPHFFEFATEPIIAREITFVKVNSLESCIKSLCELCKGSPKERDEIQDILQKQSFSRPTIDRAMEKIKENGLEKTQNRGVYET